MKRVLASPLWLLSGTFEEVASSLEELAESEKGTSIVVHINAANYYCLMKKPNLAAEIAQRTLPILDGIGLKTAIWLGGNGWHQDLNGTDLFPIVMRRAASRNLRVYLLGGTQSVVDKAARIIQASYPGIEVCGSCHGFFTELEEKRIEEDIRLKRPHILLLGLGFPRQEQFCLRWADSIGVNLMWNVGGLFDFISMKHPRAPVIVRKIRLEWLFRWLVEPVRLFRRTFLLAPLSVARIALYRFRRTGAPQP